MSLTNETSVMFFLLLLSVGCGYPIVKPPNIPRADQSGSLGLCYPPLILNDPKAARHNSEAFGRLIAGTEKTCPPGLPAAIASGTIYMSGESR